MRFACDGEVEASFNNNNKKKRRIEFESGCEPEWDCDCAEALNSDSALHHEVMQARVVCQGSFLKRRGQLTGAGEALKGPRPISLRLRPSPAFGVSRRSEGILSSRSVVVGATEGEGRGVRFAECVHGRGSAPR